MRGLTFTIMRFGVHPAIAGLAAYTLIVVGCTVAACVTLLMLT